MTDAVAEHDALLREIIEGLSAVPKRLPGKLLWDEAGSVLFDRICGHPDYYPTRCEMALLPDAARELAPRLGPGATIVEFGSGASRKVRTLLDTLDRPARYVAVDISRDYLDAAVRRLAADYPQVEMVPVCADYSRPVRLPVDRSGTVLGFFPGNSIGNLAPEEAVALLGRIRETLGPSRLLIGADPTQDEARLRRAYGACDGLMPAFHMNLLTRLAREFGAEIDRGAFGHAARILHDPFRVEAHLVAARPSTWRLGGRTLAFAAGESVRTDISHKSTPDAFRTLARQGGWRPEHLWLKPEEAFSLHLFEG